MEILAILVLMILVGNIMDYMFASRIAKSAPVELCPPHKWRYDEIKDKEGNTIKWKIVCDKCGPLQSLDAPRKMDY